MLAESAGLLQLFFVGVSHLAANSQTLSSQRLNFPQNPFHQDTLDWAWTECKVQSALHALCNPSTCDEQRIKFRDASLP